MQRMMAAAVAAVSLVLVAQGTVHAAGQPQCDPARTGQAAGAPAGQKQAATANVEAKKQADAQKYESAGANSAMEACPEPANPAAKGAASDRKQ